ncbi:MAG: hypothetical protein U0T73_13730 [Chitinophagales bacterium]
MNTWKRLKETELFRVNFKEEGKMHAQEQLKTRHQKLYMGMLFGNNFNRNVRILFNTEDGVREIFSRVWATTDRHVVLRGGAFLPISAIIDVIVD